MKEAQLFKMMPYGLKLWRTSLEMFKCCFNAVNLGNKMDDCINAKRET